MELNELKATWKKQESKEEEHLTKEQLVMVLNNKMISFDEKITARDRLEMGVAIIISLACGVLLFTLQSLWFKLACITLILACGLIIYKLRAARRVKKEDEIKPDTSFKTHLRVELKKLEKQKKLLESVLWWYLVPIFTGLLLFVIGSEQTGISKSIYLVIVLLLYGYIWKLNQDAVSKCFDPLIKDINEAISFIDPNSSK